MKTLGKTSKVKLTSKRKYLRILEKVELKHDKKTLSIEPNQNFIVDDVNAQDNYIACSLDVKSEIVIPLFVSENNIGQIDIDSNRLQAFSKKDAVFLSKVNQLVSLHLF